MLEESRRGGKSYRAPHINELTGEALDQICFVHDYLQFHFNQKVLTLYHWPDIRAQNLATHRDEPGYHDLLVLQIGKKISAASLEPGVALNLYFSNGIVLHSSLQNSAYSGPEAGQFHTGNIADALVIF